MNKKPTSKDSLAIAFQNPPAEFGIMPFWFWNDDLTEEELVRQIRAFHEKGFGGFIPHARMGLSRRIGYLTDEFFRLMQVAVEEAARLGMKVVLYDEGSYPSGSAQGRVVAEDPSYAARCLIAKQQPIAGPATGYWHPNPGRAMQDQLVCVVLAREIEPGVLDPESFTPLQILEPELVQYEVGEGNWRLIACWHVYSGGTIRGVFEEEEDGHALAPAAGDLLKPDVVDSFIRHTHEQYYARLSEHFGETIIALFTDEPSAMGRGVRRGPEPWPFTDRFLDDLQLGWDAPVALWLPALWLDCGERTAAFRHHYERTVYDRFERVFYSAQNRWCQEHNIALTGHPHSSNEIGLLRQFHWPGQDTVWRWVLPNTPSALEGEHSTAPKCASSAAALQQSRRNTTEPLGAYGWQLTLDEAKWLLDWHLVRGNNLFFLHACFYSIRGWRAYESEPDIGIHNVWWPYFGLITHYLRRLSWLLSDGVQVCSVAILTDPNNVTWDAAKLLYQSQIDFVYMGPEHLEGARVAGSCLCIGNQQIEAIVFDPLIKLTIEQQMVLDDWTASGGVLIAEWQPADLTSQLITKVALDVEWPDAQNLRYFHYRKEGIEFYLFVNEGEEPIEGKFSLASIGRLELWDPLDGSTQDWPGSIQGERLHTQLRLERRQGLVLAVDPAGEPAAINASAPTLGTTDIALSNEWQVLDDDDNVITELAGLGDWSQITGWELYSGRLCYRIHFALTTEQAAEQITVPIVLDLGDVGDIAEVIVNGQVIGVRAWAPYLFQIEEVCQPGDNLLEIKVTNSMANAYEGAQRPSGLMGPVRLR